MTPVQAVVGTGSRVSAALGRAGQVRVSRASAARARRVPVSRVLDKVSPLSRASGVLDSPLSRASGVLDSSAILSGELRSGEILSVEIHSVEPCSAAASR